MMQHIVNLGKERKIMKEGRKEGKRREGEEGG